MMTKMHPPSDDQFSPIMGLELRGILMSRLAIQHAKTADGFLWLLGQLQTRDTGTDQPTVISFKTWYPASIDFHWCVADFISWVVSHEMMELVSIGDQPLFHAARLADDHAPYMSTQAETMRRLENVRRRYQDDHTAHRWERGTLSGGLGLDLNRYLGQRG